MTAHTPKTTGAHHIGLTVPDIQAARRFYNGNVRDYRNLREAFPSNIIANMFDFEDRSFFDVEPSVRIAPDVDLA